MESLKDKTVNGLFWAAVNNFGIQVLNIVFGIFLARLLTPADYGLVSIIIAFSAIAMTLGESGLCAALINKEKPTDKEYNAVFWFSLLTGSFFFVVLFFCAPLIAEYYHQDALVSLSRVSFFSIILGMLGVVPQAYLAKHLIVKETTILRLTGMVTAGIIGIILALNGMTYWSLVAQQMIFVGIISIGKFYLIPWRPSLHIDFSPIGKMFGFSSKLLITTLVSQINQNLLTFIMGRLYPIRDVGNYTQANKWASMANSFVPAIVGQIAQPVLVSVNNEKERQLRILRKMVRFTCFLSFPALFGLSMVANEFILLTIKDEWIDSIPLLQILCIGGAFIPLHTVYQNVAISKERSDVYMYTNLLFIFLQIAIFLSFYRHGIIFIVSVTAMMNILWTVLWQVICKKLVGYRLTDALKDILPFLLITCLSISVTYFSTLWIENYAILLTARIIITATIYIVLLKMAHARILEECIAFAKQRFMKKE